MSEFFFNRVKQTHFLSTEVKIYVPKSTSSLIHPRSFICQYSIVIPIYSQGTNDIKYRWKLKTNFSIFTHSMLFSASKFTYINYRTFCSKYQISAVYSSGALNKLFITYFTKCNVYCNLYHTFIYTLV